MTRPRLTCAAEIAHVITHGVGVLSPELRPPFVFTCDRSPTT